MKWSRNLFTWCVVRRERRSQRRSLLRARSRNDFLEEPAATSGMASRAEWQPGRLALRTGGTRTKGGGWCYREGRKRGKKDSGETHERSKRGMTRAPGSILTPSVRRVTPSFLFFPFTLLPSPQLRFIGISIRDFQFPVSQFPGQRPYKTEHILTDHLNEIISSKISVFFSGTMMTFSKTLYIIILKKEINRYSSRRRRKKIIQFCYI